MLSHRIAERPDAIASECRAAQNRGEEISVEVARAIAGQWHDGQGSAFYAYSSSGHYDRPALTRELSDTIARSYPTAGEDGRLMLDMLGTFLLRPQLDVIRRDFDGIGDGELLYVDGSEECETIDCTPDEYDREDRLTAVDLAARYLNREVAVYVEPDVMPGTPSWYGGRDDAEEGTEWYIGLVGFSPAERAEIERKRNGGS